MLQAEVCGSEKIVNATKVIRILNKSHMLEELVKVVADGTY